MRKRQMGSWEKEMIRHVSLRYQSQPGAFVWKVTPGTYPECTCSNLISDTFSIVIAGAKLLMFTMMTKMPLLMKKAWLAFCLVQQEACCTVDGFCDVFCAGHVFSDSPDFLACFDSGYILLPIPILQKATHSFPWHSFAACHWRMFYNLGDWFAAASCYRTLASGNLFWGALVGPYGICYISNTRAPLISKSQPPLFLLSLRRWLCNLTLLRKPRSTHLLTQACTMWPVTNRKMLQACQLYS